MLKGLRLVKDLFTMFTGSTQANHSVISVFQQSLIWILKENPNNKQKKKFQFGIYIYIYISHTFEDLTVDALIPDVPHEITIISTVG